MKKLFLYILLAINLLGGCKNSIDRKHQITFDKRNAKSISESEIFARSKIIQLEDHERGFFSPDSKIIFENDCFYVVDNLGSQSVIQFNSNGKFLRSIGTQGKGPTEFTTLSDAIVTEKGVEILDGQNTRILSFDMFGKFHSSKEYMKKPCIAFEKCESQNLYYFHVGRLAGSDRELFVYNYNSGKIVNSEFPYQVHFPINECPFSQNSDNDKVLYRRLLSSTIYELSTSEPTSILSINFGIDKFDPDKIRNPTSLINSFGEYEKHRREHGEYQILKALKSDSLVYCFIIHYLPENRGIEIFHTLFDLVNNTTSFLAFSDRLKYNIRPAFSFHENYLYFIIPFIEERDWLSQINNCCSIVDENNENDFILIWEVRSEE